MTVHRIPFFYRLDKFRPIPGDMNTEWPFNHTGFVTSQAVGVRFSVHTQQPQELVVSDAAGNRDGDPAGLQFSDYAGSQPIGATGVVIPAGRQALAALVAGVNYPVGSTVFTVWKFDVTGDDGSAGTIAAVAASTSSSPGIPPSDPNGAIIGYVSTFPLHAQGVIYTINAFDEDGSIPYTDLNTMLICFTKGTLIETDCGAVPVESLSAGDLLLTRDNGLQPIRWIGSRFVTADEMAGNENLLPIRVRKSALGEGRPHEDLVVSQQHRVLVRSRICEKMFGEHEILIAAKQLLQLEGVDVVPDYGDLTYFHILCDQHEVILANGAETETMLPGPQALKALDAEAREEINTLFPEFFSIDYVPSPARYIPSGRRGRKMVVRHRQNSRPVFE